MSTIQFKGELLLRLACATALVSLLLPATRVCAAEVYAGYQQPGQGHQEYRIARRAPDMALDFITADALLCAEVDNVGTTRSAAWRIDFSVDGDLIASTFTEKSIEPGDHVVICTSNPLAWPHPPVTITGRVIHPWDAREAKGNNTAQVSYGRSRSVRSR